jgi:AraC-like DNA-binding protein
VSVTTIAIELGYDNPAAFTTMFEWAHGSPPRIFRETCTN